MKFLLTLFLGGAITAAFFTNPDESQHKADYLAAATKDGTLNTVVAGAEIQRAEYQDYLLFSLMESKNGKLIDGKANKSLSLGLYGMIFPL